MCGVTYAEAAQASHHNSSLSGVYKLLNARDGNSKRVASQLTECSALSLWWLHYLRIYPALNICSHSAIFTPLP